jgi:hypothetical protein
MFEIAIVSLLAIAIGCLCWICIKLIGDRLDSASIAKLVTGYLNEIGNSYAMGYNQRITSDAIQPTGPVIGEQPLDPAWSDLDKSEQHISDDESVDVT